MHPEVLGLIMQLIIDKHWSVCVCNRMTGVSLPTFAKSADILLAALANPLHLAAWVHACICIQRPGWRRKICGQQDVCPIRAPPSGEGVICGVNNIWLTKMCSNLIPVVSQIIKYDIFAQKLAIWIVLQYPRQNGKCVTEQLPLFACQTRARHIPDVPLVPWSEQPQ